MPKKRVAIIGLGYVGLPLLCAIDKSQKYTVFGFDVSKERVETIARGECPITDKQCAEDMATRLPTVTADPDDLKNTDIFIICVPTPVHEDHMPDYGPVKAAAALIGPYVRKGDAVILESTVNPGTCEEMLLPVLNKESGLEVGKDITLAHCPERIDPGNEKWNVYNIPRNIGAMPSEKAQEMADFYSSFVDAPINPVSSVKVAEATKIVENTFRDVNIAFVNELAQSFDALGVDVHETIQGAASKPFAFMPHWPGVGVGGHCIAVDPYYLIEKAAAVGFDHRFLRIARDINSTMPKYTVSRLMEGLNEVEIALKNTPVAVLGMSYKENVADLRESPSFDVIKQLKKHQAKIVIFDPHTPEYNTYATFEETMQAVDALILCTAHAEFKEQLTPAYLAKHKIKVVVDGRNKLPKQDIIKAGIVYRGIGR